MRRLTALAAILALAAAPALAQTPAAALTRIGAAAAVQGRVNAMAPGAAVGRVVQSGKPIFLNDHVTTDAQGRLQVLLLDQTVFTLGPDSDMVLDTFVYDPATDAGTVAASVTKGVFRFVTGRVARKDPANMTVRLPAGTIGIRGTMVAGEVADAGSTVILLGPGSRTNTDEPAGAVVVSNNGVSRFVSQPGTGVTVAPGQPPSAVQDLSAKANEISGQLETPPNLRAQNANSGPGAANGSASQQSGQETASAHQTSDQTLTETQSQDQSNQLFTQAAQTANIVADGAATWEQIRSNITTGQGYFFEGDQQTLTCSACLAGSGTIGSIQLQVDFGARTLGGTGGVFNSVSSQSGSFIHIHGVNNSGATDTDQQLISTINFASVTGTAQVLLNPYLGSFTSTNGSTGGTFNGTTVTLMNSGGQVAKSAVVNMQYNATSAASTAVSASGTLTAPRF